MLTLHKTTIAEAPPLDQFADRTIFQTTPWLNFVAATQGAEPVVAVVKDGALVVGRFTGLAQRRAGVRMLGSPCPGWTTTYMGFNLAPSVSRFEAVTALKHFVFHQLRCVHFEMLDRRLVHDEVARLGCPYDVHTSFEIDLTMTEEQLFAGMESSCRRAIRKSEKEGVRIEQASDLAFADDYYDQLIDVFAKQSLAPTYSRERVHALVQHLLPSGQLLLLRARNREGVCIATGIFPAMHDTMHFWGGASFRPYQHLRPNEAVQWYAMRYWKARGIIRYDMGGGSDYKRKYGPIEIKVPWIRLSRFPVLEKLRRLAKKAFSLKQRLLGLRMR